MTPSRLRHSAWPCLAPPSTLLLLALTLFCMSDCCRAAIITTSFTRSTSASVEIDYVVVESASLTVANGPSISNALFGSISDPSEARASGRADQLAMTANAEFENRTVFEPDVNNFTSVSSSSLIELNGISLSGGDVTVEFFLPPGFLELTSQGEIVSGVAPSTASIHASLLFGTPDLFGSFAPLLEFGATLTGDYASQTVSSFASSGTLGSFPFGGPASGLDLSPLTHSNLTQTMGAGPFGIPLRVTTWEYPGFSGTINLGPIPSGQPFLLRYEMFAEVEGSGPINGAAAAINDPFNITQFGAPTVDQAGATNTTVVPEPSSMALVSIGLVVLAGRRRLRQRRDES
ncbi:PEP-CTERM sorting domain-containing protein [Maioricimonas sp. JC845]|uniref:PEP-CTERM sorting domain-containing protein n=1 Tax=Maioricimonas sp. JC845 TaxID=3232138 RepID=UPI00345A8432